MRKQMILSLLMGAGCFTAAQAQVSITPEIGLGTNYRSAFEAGWTPTIKAGASVEFPLSSEVFSLESGLFYMRRGYEELTEPFSNEGGAWIERVKVNRHLLQVPIKAKFSWKVGRDVKLFCGVGAYVGYYVGDHYKSERYFTDNSSYDGGYDDWYMDRFYDDGVNAAGRKASVVLKERYDADNFDWGVTAEVGVETNRWVMKAGYDLSLGKESSADPVAANYHTLTLSVGYKFSLGK